MTREEMDRIMGVEGKELWIPEYDYGEEISDEENEELTRLLESLTPDDLETVRIERVSLADPTHTEILYLKEDI